MRFGVNAPYNNHPAQHFINKYRKLVKQGYNTDKAF